MDIEKSKVLSDSDFWRAVYQAQAISLAASRCGPEYVAARSKEVADAALAAFVAGGREATEE